MKDEADLALLGTLRTKDIEDVVAKRSPQTPRSQVRSASRVLIELAKGVANLSPEGRRFLITVDIAELIATAAGVGEIGAVEHSRGEGLGPRISLKDGRRRLDAYVSKGRLEDWAGQVAGATQLARDLGIRRTTLQDWYARRAVIGLPQGTRKRFYPLAQFQDGRPVDGVAEVLDVVGNGRLAWLWLSRPDPSHGDISPIERLRAGETATVIEAARRDFPSA